MNTPTLKIPVPTIVSTPREEIEPIRPEWNKECSSDDDLKSQIQEINTRIQRLRFVEKRVRQERDAWKSKLDIQQKTIENPSESPDRSTPTPTLPKAQFSLVQCGANESSQTTILTGTLISMSHKAYSAVKLHWSSMPQTVFLVQKARKTNTYEYLVAIGKYLASNGVTVYVEPEIHEILHEFNTYTDPSLLAHIIDFCITIGGDSTLCYLSYLFPEHCPPVLAFSIAICGFLTPYNVNDYKRAINYTLHQPVWITLRTRLFAQVVRADNRTLPATIRSDTIDFSGFNLTFDEPLTLPSPSPDRTSSAFDIEGVSDSFVCLNDFTIQRKGTTMVDLDCFLFDQKVTKIFADGIIIATPTGSTAYSVSAGGSMVHPAVPGMLLTPICPHSLSFRPMILPDSVLLRIEIPNKARGEALLISDGRQCCELHRGDCIYISVSSYPVSSISNQDVRDEREGLNNDWFSTLQTELRWNENKGKLSDSLQWTTGENHIEDHVDSHQYNPYNLYILALLSCHAQYQACTYGTTSPIPVPLGQFYIIQPPKCEQTVVGTFANSTPLPTGYTLNPTTGLISGIATGEVNTYTIIITLSSTTIVLILKTVPFAEFPNMIPVSFVESSEYNADITQDTVNTIFNGQAVFYSTKYNEGNIVCAKDNVQCGPNLKSAKLYYIMTVAFEVTEETEDIYFELNVDDRCWIYLDNLDNTWKRSTYWNQYFKETVTFEKGTHFFFVIGKNIENEVAIYFKWKRAGDSDAVYMSADNGAKAMPPPLQYVEWRTLDMLMILNEAQTLTPIVTGFMYEPTSTPTLPKGLSMNEWGIINGAPSEIAFPQAYGLSMKNWDLSYSVTNYITIQVLQNSDSNMANGLDGLYYSSPDRSCDYRDISSFYDELKFRRFDEKLPKTFSTSAWDGLSGDFNNQFTVVWTGVLKATDAGTYTISTTTYGGIQIVIGGKTVIQTIGCGNNGMHIVTGNVDLVAGYNDLKITYWKSAGNALKMIQIQWDCITAGIYKTEIPDANFLRMPRYSFSYRYETAEYIKNAPITENCPMYQGISDTSIYTTFTSSPELPLGLNVSNVEPNKGCIYGTITTEEESLDSTYFTITASTAAGKKLQSRMTLSYKSYQPITSVTFNSPIVTSTLGTSLEITPIIDGNYYTVQVSEGELPSGLSINSMTGVISGIPTESITSRIITVTATNALGSKDGSVTITITGCTANSYFLQFAYITGYGNGLSVLVAGSDSNRIYSQNSHDDDTYYGFMKCVTTPNIIVTITQSKGRVGTYIISQEGKKMLKYGKWSNTQATTINVNLQNVDMIPLFKYENSVIAIVRGEYYELYPQIMSSSVTEFTSTELPPGLSLNSTTGLIYGTVGAVDKESGTITITAKNTAQSSTPVTITYTHTVGCLDNKVLLRIISNGGIDSKTMTLRVVDSLSNEVYSINGIAPYSRATYSQCNTVGSYTIYYGSTTGYSWDINTYVYVYNRDELMSTLRFKGGKEAVYSAALSIEIPTTAEWEYSSTFTPGWNLAGQTGWPKASAGYFTRGVGVTMYYRKTITMASLDAYSRFTIKGKTDGGVVGYINGVEFYRTNMPEGTVTDSTYATSGTDGGIDFNITALPTLLVANSQISFAFETHKTTTTTAQNDPFQIRMAMLANSGSGCETLYTGTIVDPPDVEIVYDSTDPTATDFTCKECSAYLFDNDRNSKGLRNSNLGKADFVLKLSKAMQYDTYYIVTSNDCSNRDPAAWTIYGTNVYTGTASDIWIQIDHVDDDNALPGVETSNWAWTSRQEAVKFVAKTVPKVAFQYIKFSVERNKYTNTRECTKDYRISFADFYPAVCSALLCLPSNPFPLTKSGTSATAICSNGVSGIMTRPCNDDGTWGDIDLSGCNAVQPSLSYAEVPALEINQFITPIVPTMVGTIVNFRTSPELPNDLSIDKTTGIISGYINEEINPAKSYKIIGDTYEGKGKISFTIYLQTTLPSCPAFDTFPATPVNEMIAVKCDKGFSGKKTRLCIATNPPSWDNWDISNCQIGEAPDCTYPSNDYELSLYEDVGATITPNCVSGGGVAVLSIEIDAALPTGLTFNEQTGAITGSPTSPLRKNVYTVKFKSATGYVDVELSITVWGKLTKCQYVFVGDINTVVNEELTLAAPSCNFAVQNFTATYIPDGMKISRDGIVKGTPTKVQNYTVKITATNPVNSISFNLKINVLKEILLPKLFGKYTYEVYTWVPDILTIWNGLEDGTIEYEWADSPDDLSNWVTTEKNKEFTFGQSVKRTKYYAATWKGVLIVDQTGTYNFKIAGDDRIAVFFDSFDKIYSQNWSWDGSADFSITLSAGNHPFGVFYYQGENEYKVLIQWKKPGSDSYEFIPDSLLKHSPVLLSTYAYTSSEYVFFVGVDIGRIVPDVQGSYTQFISKNDMPNGLTFENAIITGTPTTAMKRTLYTFTCTSLTTTIETSIFITVVELTKENLLNGVSGSYYTSSAYIGCNYVDVSSGGYTLKYHRTIPTFYHAASTAIWTGLSGEFSLQFAAKWIGYLDVPEKGTYTFTVSGMDGVRFEISDTVITPLQTCSFSSGTGTVELEQGLHPITVNFWKTPNNAMTAVSVQWEKLYGIAIPRAELPAANLYHVETSSFSYDFSIASYTVNVKIADNSPVFFAVSKDSYTSFYVEPPLPSGINLNTKSGVISGIPKKAASTAYYTVTTTHTDGSTLSYALSIIVNPYNPPLNLTYTPISGQVGVEMTDNAPALGSGENVRYSTSDILPVGLSVDPMTGAIIGTPSHTFTGKITVKCSNPSGSVEATVDITITACEGSKIFVTFEYDLGNKQVGFTIIDSTSASFVNIVSGSLSDFATGKQSQCIASGMATLTITSTAKAGGIFRIYMEGQLLKVGEWKDISDTVTFPFAVAAVSGLPSIASYSQESALIAGIYYSFYPTLAVPATSFEIKTSTSNELPETLSFDTTTGVIKGSLSTDALSLTITPLDNKGTKGTPYPLTLSATACSKTLIGLIVKAGTDGSDKVVQFKQQLGVSNLVDLANLKSNSERTYTFCEDTGNYILTLGSSNSKHWNDGTLVTISIGGDNLMSFALEYDTSSLPKVISLNTLIDSKSEWQTSSVQPTSGWYSEYIPGAIGWQIITASIFPSRSSITTYYRTKFDYSSSISTVAQLQLSLTFDAGIICYLNGNEFYRRNLPMTGVTNTYMADEIFIPARVMSITVGKHLLQTGTNYFAIEVHKHAKSEAADPLSVLLTPLLAADSDVDCSIRTISSSAKPTMDASTAFGTDPTWYNPFNLAYDWSTNTFYHSKKLYTYDFPGDFIFKWPVGRAEFFNTLMLRNPDDWMDADHLVNDIIVYGAFNRDNPEWLKIKEFNPVITDVTKKKSFTFEMENNIRSFEAYRIQVISIVGKSEYSYIKFSEIETQNCKPAICASDGDWKETVANNRAFLKCPTGQYGYRERLCYLIPNSNMANFLGVEDHCSASPATQMTYGTNNVLTFYLQSYGNYTPTINGGIDSYSIDCILPSGIIFNPRYGRILGMPIAESDTAAVCTVTGYTGSTSFTSQVTIYSKVMKCLSDGLFEDTIAGSYATRDCGIGYDGKQSRYCDGSTGSPEWKNPDRSTCILLPPKIEYLPAEYSFNLNDPVFITPTLEGAEIILIYSTTLPNRLTISANTGIISGTALAATAADGVDITVTVMQASASSTTTLNIKITNTVSSIKYDPSSYIFHIGFMNQTSPPTIVGSIILTYAVPTLPAGLALDITTGVISGTPFAGISEGSETYRVRGIRNTESVESNEITIQIVQPKCQGIDSDYPTTNGGITVTASCPEGQTGTRSRTCSNEINPNWSDEISTCQEKPKVCSAADGFPDTAPGIFATLDCGSGYTGQKQRYCGYDVHGNPAWQNIIDNCVAINPSIVYRTNEIIQLKNTQITPIQPVLTQITGALKVNPTLPTNFQFDTSTGTISGSGAAEQTRQAYTVSGTGTDGKTYTATIGITITESYATSIIYPETSMKFYVNIEDNSYDPPTANGVVKLYSINPSLPSGLSITSDSGKIYGKVAKGTEESSKSYVVSAAVSGSPITATINIQIIQPKCSATASGSITWPETSAGETVEMNCPTGYDGSKKRTCGEGKTPVWGQESGTCTPKLPSFNYPKSSYSFTYNEDIGTISPQNIVNGPITTWSSVCTIALEGIEFSTTTGIYTGKATKALTTTCKVTGSNSLGSSSQVSITFSITLPKCSSDGRWPSTDISKYAQVLCDEGYGMMVRYCESDISNNLGIWGNIDRNQCRSSDTFTPDSNKDYVKVILTISSVTGSLNNAMKLAIQVSISESLDLVISKVYVEEHVSRLRSLQSRTVILDIYMETNDPSDISSQISSTSIQQAIRNKLRTSDYTSAFSSSSFSFDSASVIEKEKSSSNAGAIAGGVIGGLIGLLIIVLVVVFFLRNHSVVLRRPSKPVAANHAGVRAGKSYGNLVGGDDEVKNEKKLGDKSKKDDDDDDDDDEKDTYVKPQKKRKAKKEESSDEEDDSSDEETSL